MCTNKRLKTKDLIEGVDFYWEDKDGMRWRVFTEEYLRQVRPVCCKSGCRHCPWKYQKK
jgi:hypothetical protein